MVTEVPQWGQSTQQRATLTACARKWFDSRYCCCVSLGNNALHSPNDLFLDWRASLSLSPSLSFIIPDTLSLDLLSLYYSCIQSFKICSHYSFTLWSPLAVDQQPNLIQNSSHLPPHYLWYSSSVPLRVASPLSSFSFSSFSLRYSDFPCSKGVQEDSWGEILSVYWTCHLELFSFLCRACHVTLHFQVKT